MNALFLYKVEKYVTLCMSQCVCHSVYGTVCMSQCVCHSVYVTVCMSHCVQFSMDHSKLQSLFIRSFVHKVNQHFSKRLQTIMLLFKFELIRFVPRVNIERRQRLFLITKKSRRKLVLLRYVLLSLSIYNNYVGILLSNGSILFN